MNKLKIAVSILFILLGFYLMFSCNNDKSLIQIDIEESYHRAKYNKSIDSIQAGIDSIKLVRDSIKIEIEKL